MPRPPALCPIALLGFSEPWLTHPLPRTVLTHSAKYANDNLMAVAPLLSWHECRNIQ